MIKAEALTRTYGDVVAVNNVSFEIGPQEIVGLLGHNGAGKTTIMKMVTGYLEPTSGSITVDGRDAFWDRQEVQKRIGYLPENCPLYQDMFVLDYLDYAASLRGVESERRLERMRYAVEKTNLESVALKVVNTLSRGFRQRLGVAQALLNSPSILILDEPTNGLDPSQILEMRSLIRELSQTATIVISTHILQEVQALCGRVIIINQGKLALDAKLSELQFSARLFLATDKPPEVCENLFAAEGNVSLAEHQLKDNQHQYTLDAKGGDVDDVVQSLAKILVEKDCKIYSLRPLTRDLESIFRELTSGEAKVNQNRGSNGSDLADGPGQASVNSENTEAVTDVSRSKD
jgi:ABC-2 type transport system ATP-binding protein